MTASQPANVFISLDTERKDEPGAGPNRRVYIVDDDSMVRRALFFALRAGGYNPRSFSSGEDFLQEAEALPDGCVLLDLRMPGLDGIAVLDRLGDQISRLPVVIITAHGEVSSAVAAMKRGASDFVEKPFNDSTVFEVLEQVFARAPVDAGTAMARRDAMERLERLTRRETQVLQGIVAGLANKQVAHRFGLSVRTVEVHRANLMSRLEVGSFAEAIKLAMLGGLQALEREASG